MARVLDLTREYASIYGEGPRVIHEQDGLRFDYLGRQIVGGVVAPDPDPEPSPTDDEIIDYRRLSTAQLKALVRSFGETYTNKAAALAFLEGRSSNSLPTWDEA